MIKLFYKFSKFFKSLWWVDLCWMSPRTEILATSLQYRTWKDFMYEIFSDVSPSNQNPGAAPIYIYIYWIFMLSLVPPQFLYVADPMEYMGLILKRFIPNILSIECRQFLTQFFTSINFKNLILVCQNNSSHSTLNKVKCEKHKAKLNKLILNYYNLIY